MILSDFILSRRQNQILKEFGMDSKQYCFDKKHFNAYPYVVEYKYNKRGFRDSEWPSTLDSLKNSIWCFGDSFTVGVGSPVKHTWVKILQQRTRIRCINVSMDGASNDWIVRKINRVIEEISPKAIVIHWSYLHRAENSNINLTDEDRREEFISDVSLNNQLVHFTQLRNKLKKSNTTKIIESFVPGGFPMYTHKDYREKINEIKGSDWPNLIDITLDEFKLIDKSTKKDLEKMGMMSKVTDYLENKHLLDIADNFIFVNPIDVARDGHHYGHLTAGKLVDSIIDRFTTLSS